MSSVPNPELLTVGEPVYLATPAALPTPSRTPSLTEDPTWVRWTLITLAAALLVLFVGFPVAVILSEALAKGWQVYVAALLDDAALSAIRLTLLVAAIAVPLNTLFGLVAAWSLTRFRFTGRSVLISLIDLPFGISPVIAGMLTALLFGARGVLGPFLAAHGLHVVFALPGVIISTVFVTFPFVARELIATLEAQGTEEEEAALVLGASGWQIFTRLTLPNVKWSLLYGIILCNARAMGEFGAVSVVSGHILGRTATIPLAIEARYDEYNFSAAFALASLLLLLAGVTLVAKKIVAWKTESARLSAGRSS